MTFQLRAYGPQVRKNGEENDQRKETYPEKHHTDFVQAALSRRCKEHYRAHDQAYRGEQKHHAEEHYEEIHRRKASRHMLPRSGGMSQFSQRSSLKSGVYSRSGLGPVGDT